MNIHKFARLIKLDQFGINENNIDNGGVYQGTILHH